MVKLNRYVKISKRVLLFFALLFGYFYRSFFLLSKGDLYISKDIIRSVEVISSMDINISVSSSERAAFKLIMDVLSKRTINRIMLTVINDGYSLLGQNWLCNTLNMVTHDKVLMITTSEQVSQELLSISKDVHIVTIPVDDDMKEHLDYTHAGYLRLMALRTKILNVLLENDIEIFLFECDFLWLQNPIEIFLSKKGKYDMIFIPDSMKRHIINGGFYYLFPTNGTKALFYELTILMAKFSKKLEQMSPKQHIPEYLNDQIFLTYLVRTRSAGIKTLLLPCEDFPSGLWYQMPKSKVLNWKPFVIHNNWIIGDGRKITRAIRKGHWFLDEKRKCNYTKVIQVSKQSFLLN